MTRRVMALLAIAIMSAACGSAHSIQSQEGVVVAPDQAQPDQVQPAQAEPQPAQAPANGQGQGAPAPAVPAQGGACSGGGRPAHLCPPP